MTTEPRQGWIQRYLNPGDRMNEVLFGLIMVLTFTLTAGLSVSEGREGVRELLVAAIGCNFAWGIIDGVFFVMGALFDRGRNLRLAKAVRQVPDEATALAAIAREFDGHLEGVTTEEARRSLYREIIRVVRREEPLPNRVTKEDLYGALASFWLVFLSTIPAVVPFLIFVDQPRFALRVSNGLLVGMLFYVGHRWARYTGGRPWRTGFTIAMIGVALVAIAVALGG
jgi:VIT1/CCC1 family predicted Fe2+/Mn2+ transporter